MSVACSFSFPTYKEPPMFLAAVRKEMGKRNLLRETAPFALA